MTGVRRTMDVGRLSAAASQPGIDTRIWLTLAVVTDIGFDAAEGVFVDVQYQPTGENETCYLAMPFAGSGFGVFFPVEVDDTVLVAVPSGDPNNGPWVIARAWNAGDAPPADFGDGDEPIDYVYFKGKDGKDMKFVTQGDEAKILFQAGTQSFIRGEDYADAEAAFLDALSTFVRQISTAATPAPPNAALTVASVIAAAEIFQPAITQFKEAKQNYLSTKIKGE